MIGLRGMGKLLVVMVGMAMLLMLPPVPPAPAQSSAHGGVGTTGTGRPPIPPNEIENDLPDSLSLEQKQNLMRANFERSKSDAEELAELAKGLREALGKPPRNVPASEIVLRADKIEKLARKIHDETKGF